MGYELQVFRGNDPDDERTFEPLDEDVVRDLLLQVERAGDVGEEIVVPRRSLTATVALSRDREGGLRSLWVSVDAHDEDASRREWEFRPVLDALADTADRLGARLFDRQERRFLGRADLDGVIAELGRAAAS